MTLRLFVLQAHYRKPLDFTRKPWRLLQRPRGSTPPSDWANARPKPRLDQHHPRRWCGHPPGQSQGDELQGLEQRFISAMDDDINSSGALAVLFDLAKPLEFGHRLIAAIQPTCSPQRSTIWPSAGTCCAIWPLYRATPGTRSSCFRTG